MRKNAAARRIVDAQTIRCREITFSFKIPEFKGTRLKYSPCQGKFDTFPGEDKEVTIP